jgi:hypothetical protein
MVLTFDDGPWPKKHPGGARGAAARCTKTIFFPIGLQATYDPYDPQIPQGGGPAGHAIGSPTWRHHDLSNTRGTCVVGATSTAPLIAHAASRSVSRGSDFVDRMSTGGRFYGKCGAAAQGDIV